MNRPVDPDPAVQTTFSVNTLDKATRTADNTINWQPDIISIRKHTFNPVVNLKSGITLGIGFCPASHEYIGSSRMGMLSIRDSQTILFCRLDAPLIFPC